MPETNVKKKIAVTWVNDQRTLLKNLRKYFKIHTCKEKTFVIGAYWSMK